MKNSVNKATSFSIYLFSGRGDEQEGRQEERTEQQKLDTGRTAASNICCTLVELGDQLKFGHWSLNCSQTVSVSSVYIFYTSLLHKSHTSVPDNSYLKRLNT